MVLCQGVRTINSNTTPELGCLLWEELVSSFSSSRGTRYILNEHLFTLEKGQIMHRLIRSDKSNKNKDISPKNFVKYWLWLTLNFIFSRFDIFFVFCFLFIYSSRNYIYYLDIRKQILDLTATISVI